VHPVEFAMVQGQDVMFLLISGVHVRVVLVTLPVL
jgi:hypothetical protein